MYIIGDVASVINFHICIWLILQVTGENKQLANELASKTLPEVIRKTHFSEEEQIIEVTSITLFEHVGIE